MHSSNSRAKLSSYRRSSTPTTMSHPNLRSEQTPSTRSEPRRPSYQSLRTNLANFNSNPTKSTKTSNQNWTDGHRLCTQGHPNSASLTQRWATFKGNHHTHQMAIRALISKRILSRKSVQRRKKKNSSRVSWMGEPAEAEQGARRTALRETRSTR